MVLAFNNLKRAHWFWFVICCFFSSNAGQGAEIGNSKDTQSVGLFIGIGKFKFRSGLENLEYAPDDAVALAHRFVVELKMVEPRRAQLVLAGEPKSTQAQKELKELRAAGVEEASGTKNGLLKALKKFSAQAGSGGLAIMSFSGHGYETQKDVYLMPANGNWQTVRTTGVSFETVLETLHASRARTKVLLFDACRQVPDMAKLDREQADKAFHERVKSVEGLTILASCRAGEKSWQAKSLEQGVFTHLVLEQMKGKDVAWSEVGEQVAKANETWYARFEVKGPTAWVSGEGKHRTSNTEP